MTLVSTFHEQLGEEIHAWAARERASRPGASMSMLMNALARALGLQGERQVYRYISGETPFPAEKLIVLCRKLGSWRLLQALNQDAGLVANPVPAVDRLESFDLIVEQSRNLQEFGELVAAYAQASDAPADEVTYRRLVKEGREVILQVDRLLAIYGAMVEQRAQQPAAARS